MTASETDERVKALADVLALWATQPVLRERLMASLDTKPVDTVANLMGLEVKALKGKRKRAVNAAAVRLLVLFRTIARSEERSAVDYRLTAGSVKKLFVPWVISLSGTIGPLESGAAGTVGGQSGNQEICDLRTEEVERRYRELQDALRRWDVCAADHDGPLESLEEACLAVLMNMWAAGDAYVNAQYLRDIACSGIRD